MTALVKQPRLCAEFRPGPGGVELYFHVEGRGRFLIGRESEIGNQPGPRLKIAPQTTRTYADIGGNAAINKARGLPHIDDAPMFGGAVSICGPGPGLVPLLDSVALDQKRGGQVWALKGTWRAIVSRGTIPDAVLMMDGHPSQVAYTAGAPGGMRWYLASMAAPAVFDALADEDVVTWDAAEGKGLSIGAHAVLLAAQRGFSDIRLYGFDCSWTGEKSHLYELANRQAAAAADPIEAFHNGERYTTTREMAVEARQIMRLIRTLRARVAICGGGLLPDLWRGDRGH